LSLDYGSTAGRALLPLNEPSLKALGVEDVLALRDLDKCLTLIKETTAHYTLILFQHAGLVAIVSLRVGPVVNIRHVIKVNANNIFSLSELA